MNTTLGFLVYTGLLSLGVPYWAAVPVAYAVGALNGYFFNRRWTFQAKDSTRARVVYISLLAVGATVTSLLVAVLIDAGLSEIAAYVVAIPPVTIMMFLANRTWAFGDR